MKILFFRNNIFSLVPWNCRQGTTHFVDEVRRLDEFRPQWMLTPVNSEVGGERLQTRPQ